MFFIPDAHLTSIASIYTYTYNTVEHIIGQDHVKKTYASFKSTLKGVISRSGLTVITPAFACPIPVLCYSPSHLDPQHPATILTRL